MVCAAYFVCKIDKQSIYSGHYLCEHPPGPVTETFRRCRVVGLVSNGGHREFI